MKSFISHPLAIASVPLALFFSLLFDLFFLLSLIISVFYCLNCTSPVLHLISTHLVSHLPLSSIIFSISTLIIDIFHCYNYISLLLHLAITHLANMFYNNFVINISLGNYYDLYKYHKFCTNQLT